MRRAAAFMLLFLLALGALGGASAYLTRDAYDLRGELLLGDRADAAGVAVRERTVLSGHMAWSAQYSAGDAAVSAQNAWTISDAAAAPSPAPGLGTYSEPFGASWEIRGEEDVPGRHGRGDICSAHGPGCRERRFLSGHLYGQRAAAPDLHELP